MAIFQARLWNADKTGWRVLVGRRTGEGSVKSATWRTTATDGYADATLTLNGAPSDTPGLFKKRRIEFWGLSCDDGTWRLLYRGRIGRVQMRRGGNTQGETTVVTIYGIFTDVGKLVSRQRYVFPEGGLDIGSIWSRIANRYGAAAYPDVVFQGGAVGQTLDAFDAYDKTLYDDASTLVEQAGGFCVSGGDSVTDPADVNYQKDRCFVRAFDPVPPAQPPAATLFIPDKRTGERNADEDTRNLVNVLYLEGGADLYPNLLAQAVSNNTGFEYPAFGGGGDSSAAVGNILQDPDFENRNDFTLSGGASYKSGSLDEGATDGGTWMVLLDGVGEEVSQQTPVASVTPGGDYVFAPRLRLTKGGTSVGCQVVAKIEWQDAGGAALSSVSLTFDNTTTNPAPLADAIWRTYPVVARCPVGASRVKVSVHMTVMHGSSGAHDGVVCDNFAFYNGSIVYQQGWELYIPGSGVPSMVNWAYDADACPVGKGAYSIFVEASITTPNTDNQDLPLRPIGGARFAAAANQNIRLSFWAKSPPGYTATPAIQMQLYDYQSDGTYLGVSKFDIAASASPLTDWTRFDLTKQLNAKAANVLAAIVFRTSGALLIDDVSVRDAASDPNTWLEASQFTATVRADDATLGLSSDIEASITDYGEIDQITPMDVITNITDARSYAVAVFKANGTPIIKPYVEQFGRCLTIWPGQYVIGQGEEAADYFPDGKALPIAEIEGDYDGGTVRQKFYLSQERETDVRRLREIARTTSFVQSGLAVATTGQNGSTQGGTGNGGDPTGGTAGFFFLGVYDSARTYRVGEAVRTVDGTALYQSLTDPNLGNDPESDGGVNWTFVFGFSQINQT